MEYGLIYYAALASGATFAACCMSYMLGGLEHDD